MSGSRRGFFKTTTASRGNNSIHVVARSGHVALGSEPETLAVSPNRHPVCTLTALFKGLDLHEEPSTFYDSRKSYPSP